MANPIFNAFANNSLSNFQNKFFGGGNQNGFADMLGRFNQFKAQFQGDPKQQVEQLVQSGQMSKEQFEFFSDMAKRFQGMTNVRR